MHFNSKAITNAKYFIIALCSWKIKSLPEETVGQEGYSSANVWKNVPQTGISEFHVLSCSFVTWLFFFWEMVILLSFSEQLHQ